MKQFKIGIVGSGSIALAYAAWAADRGHAVILWSPRSVTVVQGNEPVCATGALEGSYPVRHAKSPSELCAHADILVIAVPLNGHRQVMDALLPHMKSAQTILVSSMGSLSALYAFETAQSMGLTLTVGSFGTTVLTARRTHPNQVRIMTHRKTVPVSCLPRFEIGAVLATCEAIFGDSGFVAEGNVLVSTLANTNPVSHVPLALFNWTRIERAESWPQYHYMTAHVASVIQQLDGERIAIAKAFGIEARGIEQHLSRSFNTDAQQLAEIASELHRKRGGPPGPTDVHTRYLSEDVPFGLVFLAAIGKLVDIRTPVTDALVATSSLIAGQDFGCGNDLLAPLCLAQESAAHLLQRVCADRISD